jgi:two-component system NtrC family sensor kinase
MKKGQKIPLFWKFTIAIVGTVGLFGVINLYFINYVTYDLFESELIRHGRITATGIAERGIDPIVYSDLVTLDRVVTDQKSIDSTIAYIFILDKNKTILAHTFELTVPEDLIHANIADIPNIISVVKIQKIDKPGSTIRDISVPILEGNLGFVRIGLHEESYLKSMKRTSGIFIYMVFLFLFFGIIGAFFFSYIITTPLKSISKIAKKIELGTLDIHEENFETTLNRSEIVKWKNILNVKDEIDTLIESFGDMVSRLKTTYTELQRTQKSLFQSEKMASLGTLSAGLAHEINNPIAGMQNCVRRLKESPENLKQNVTYLEIIGDGLEKVVTVVKSLLEFSRKPEILFTEVNLNDIIENALLLVSFRLEKSRIAISKHSAIEPVIISASPNHIEQVVLNLVLNSIDAIDEKIAEEPGHTGEIRFNSRENKNYVELEITDNGVGVPEENLADIFDPFFTRKKIRPGTGLGLAVSYSIIEQHGGKFRTLINDKGGLTIFVLFPKNKMNESKNQNLGS